MLIVLYSIGMYVLVLGVLLASIVSKKARKLVEGIPQTFKILKAEIKPDDRVVWFHAASLGEFEQGRPLMQRLREEYPEYKILLTFFSPSGYEVRKNYNGADVICYLPFDTPGNVHSFLRLAHPEIALFIKYEFWMNYLTTAKKKGVKLYSVSSIFREKQYFFQWWGTMRPLKQFDHLFVQNEESKRLLNKHGIDCVTVVGDTRLDRVIDIKDAAAPLPLVEQFVAGSPCFIAGSSWGPDEEIYIPYLAQQKDWKLIIAPHVISAVHLKSINKLLEDNGLKAINYSDLEAGKSTITDERVMIVDCFGKLSSIYRYGKIALVGGGFGVGIHNVPEAAVYGIPVLFGPNNRKFKEAQDLKQCGGAFEYQDEQSFAAIMDTFINNPQTIDEAGKKAGKYINGNAGAANICFNMIFK
jgi:3-deoxy-D-manno-octulosonic-acid transferase